MNSGSEAVMNAIKAARAFTGRPKIAKCDGFYHGSYDYAEVSLSSGPADWAQEDPVSKAYSRGTPQSALDEVVVIPFNEPQHAQRILERHAGELACIMLDTTPMRLGSTLIREDYLATLASIAKAHDTLLMFDEVVSFRLGYSGSQGILGVQPDITALGKIIGGGFPVGAVAGSARVMSVFETGADGAAPLPHGGTFNANPMTMVAGLAAMRDMTREAFDKLNALGDQTRVQLGSVFEELGIPGQITGSGSMFKIHLHDRPLVTIQDGALSASEQTANPQLRTQTDQRRIVSRHRLHRQSVHGDDAGSCGRAGGSTPAGIAGSGFNLTLASGLARTRCCCCSCSSALRRSHEVGPNGHTTAVMRARNAIHHSRSPCRQRRGAGGRSGAGVHRTSDRFPEYKYIATPLMIDGVLYVTAGLRRAVVAIDAITGETLWVYRFDEGTRTDSAPRRNSGRGCRLLE